ncbi:MAG: EscU/YscU/HrcU family type III secretion system export apparatus switch protein [Gammaproteobacteria bacterium]|nr:EscU/YscU/HrcU family type III secretion system export apparatus switch protein [Gammaproteobacteria bacterium]
MKKSNDKQPNQAAALKYDGANTPTLVAKGYGAVAEQIITEAEKHGVHIHSDPALVSILNKLELGDEIPETLYLAVARVIAFAYFLQGKHPDYQSNDDKENTPNIETRLLGVEMNEAQN